MQFEAAATARASPLEVKRSTSAALLPPATAANVIDGLLLLLEQALLQVIFNVHQIPSVSLKHMPYPQCQIWTSCAQPQRAVMAAALLR